MKAENAKNITNLTVECKQKGSVDMATIGAGNWVSCAIGSVVILHMDQSTAIIARSTVHHMYIVRTSTVLT